MLIVLYQPDMSLFLHVLLVLSYITDTVEKNLQLLRIWRMGYRACTVY